MTDTEIKIAKNTSRGKGTTVFDNLGNIRAVVPRFVEQNVDKSSKILDFGAGKDCVISKNLISKGFNMTAYDLWCGEGDKLLDKNALSKKYNVVMMSNVLNVQSSPEMLNETINSVYEVLVKGGILFANLPNSPRKMGSNSSRYLNPIEDIFHTKINILSKKGSSFLFSIVK